MEIVVTHLTRMGSGRICVAGNEVETLRSIRPLLSFGHFKDVSLSTYGGPFLIGGIVDIGAAKPASTRPQTENHILQMPTPRPAGLMHRELFWRVIERCSSASLAEIFGSDLTIQGKSCIVIPGAGTTSLGFLTPAYPPFIYVKKTPKGENVRISISDGVIDCDLSVTDVRLYRQDSLGKWVPRREVVYYVMRRLSRGEPVICAVGLTHPFAPNGGQGVHWLQMNNLHFLAPSLYDA